MKIISHPLYLAPVSLYARLYAADGIIMDCETPFYKQTYRNRTLIAAENGALPLTIPIIHNGGEKQAMRDVKISEHGNWQRSHWNALNSAYKKSPFFDYYADDFHIFYEKKIKYLADFNIQLHETVCKLLGLERTTEILDNPIAEISIEDVRAIAQPSCIGFDGFTPKQYYQIFENRNGFLPNISIADLLFNMGPEGLIVLRDSVGDKNIEKQSSALLQKL